MTFRDILPIEPEIMDAMRKYEKTQPIMMFADYLDEQQRKREDFIIEEVYYNDEETLESFSEKELQQLENRRRCLQSEMNDENVLEQMEKIIYDENDTDNEISQFEKDNEKVFVKSLYRI